MLLLQQPRTGDVIGVHVRFERGNERELELAQQRSVATRLFEYRIDENGLAAARIAEQIGVGRGLRIEQLAEDQHDGRGGQDCDTRAAPGARGGGCSSA